MSTIFLAITYDSETWIPNQREISNFFVFVAKAFRMIFASQKDKQQKLSRRRHNVELAILYGRIRRANHVVRSEDNKLIKSVLRENR